MSFSKFRQMVSSAYASMQEHELFCTEGSDELFKAYLAAFPPGTDPVFRMETWHTCNTCRRFLVNLGGLVAIVNGERRTVWDDHASMPEPYNHVAAVLCARVRTAKITGVFRSTEVQFGVEKTPVTIEDKPIVFEHLHGSVAERHEGAGDARGFIDTSAAMLKRALSELTVEALTNVLELIAENNLYRGAEFQQAVSAFLNFKTMSLGAGERLDDFCWANAGNAGVARFRNSVIGTLVADLSEGIPSDVAIRAFEAKVAPANYKRPTAVVTARMIDAALADLRAAGLERAVERRLARLSDVSVNDVLWVDNAVQGQMRDALRDVLMDAVPPKPSQLRDTVQPISIEEFVKTILPQASKMSVVLTPQQTTNLVALTAPVHADAPPLFPWGAFAWSYIGNVTDSIKERVKAAGGQVEGRLRVSLAWDNTDDLDLHCRLPNGREIYYGSKRWHDSRTDGELDVDANGPGGRLTTTPVENIVFSNLADGVYVFSVNMYQKRTKDNVGFFLELASKDRVLAFRHPTDLFGRRQVLNVVVRGGDVVDVTETSQGALEVMNQNRTAWGVTTGVEVPVEAMLNSPNHWENGTKHGAKHWIFALKGCKTDAPIRGFYNEFLGKDFMKHSKVFEVLGMRLLCPVTQEQVAGVGFTSARNDKVTIRVQQGTTRRSYEVTF